MRHGSGGKSTGVTVWLAGTSGYDSGSTHAVFADRPSAELWLERERERCVRDAVRMNAHEREDRARKLADLDSGVWDVRDAEGMRRHLTDPSTLDLWAVGDITREATASRFTYVHDEYRIFEWDVISNMTKKADPA